MTPNNTFHGHTKIILDRALPAYTVILFPTLLLLTSVGCGEAGPELGGVSGQVTLDGEPLANANIAFSGVNNGPSAYATTDHLGFYELQFNHKNKGTVLGKQEVSITTRRTGRVKPEPGQEDEADDDGLIGLNHPEILPARYHTSAAVNPEMMVEVSAGNNTIDFTLTSKKNSRLRQFAFGLPQLPETLNSSLHSALASTGVPLFHNRRRDFRSPSCRRAVVPVSFAHENDETHDQNRSDNQLKCPSSRLPAPIRQAARQPSSPLRTQWPLFFANRLSRNPAFRNPAAQHSRACHKLD